MKNRQSGLATVEFAIIGMLFFIVLFAVIEFGRLLFTWNTLTEATRRGARVAAVCPVNHPAIARITVFNRPGGGGSPVLPNLAPGDVAVQYLGDNGNDLGNAPSFSNIAYVSVGISGNSDGVPGYQHQMLIPLLAMTLTSPWFQTTLPRESLGQVPGTIEQCPFS
ncbi:MAG: TadE/TadG family type IV pilus assembly protein [Chromatiales bacterium]